MKYCNGEIDFTEEHMTDIATSAIHLLKERLDDDEFEDFIMEHDIEPSQLKFFELDYDRCPICNGKLEQETYYNGEDTGYYNYCERCGYNDYPEDLLEVTEDEESYDDFEESVILGKHPYLTPLDL